MASELAVFLHEQRIGTLTRAARGSTEQVQLTWAADYQPGAVRVTESFTTIPGARTDVNLVSRFLGGYGPEGNQREAMASERGIAPNDLFGILREFGGSIAGALTFLPAEDIPASSPSYEPLSDSELNRMLKRAVEDHDLGQRDDSRSMIPGFQPKLLLANFGAGWLQPHGSAHSTHIIKPLVPSRPHLIADEYFSHELTRAMGLSRFGSELHTVGQTPYLAIERFDRTVTGETVTLVHQEDCAQALGLDWVNASSKFQDKIWPANPQRPSAARIAEAAASLNGENPLSEWLRQLTYRVLVGDNDGHAKNTGILHLPGEDTLTQVYDSVPNLYQSGRIDWTMALAIDGQFDHRHISAERLINEATRWGVMTPRSIEKTVSETFAAFDSALNSTRPPVGISPGLLDGMEWNLSRLLAGDEISEPRR
ncbi:type II toxin-antitoxin system HipA family toxin [Salinibacterium sp. UTAS2018]|uniref:type II toxin-antitoxin system HipA family toxin n=1 Tax=Salinibacterium sp. UTAS2018 TaxID=2508880 RepID=UPI0010097EC5|nr:HipA domain-containing protein [Salinibacterium sp. UTAS2018]QAV70476.1 type II toxin-antitoxin system HipA family toxin [Salinibacterium sp. UTAS2018]